MLDDIALKLRRSRETAPIFGERVTVVADPSRAIEYTALAYPAGYVSFLSDEAETQVPGSNDNRQRITNYYGVIVGLEATPDIRGHEPARTIEEIQPAIFRAIYNWSPDKAFSPLWYDGTKLLQISRANTFWMMSFGAYAWVCGEDGETEENFEPLPDFLGANIKIDWMQPHDPGLPPSQEYDPARGPAPWSTGPEGRIETEVRVDVPWTTLDRIVSLSNRRRGD